MRAPLAFFLASLAGVASAGDRPKGVVELFTSQGCSSCPPADIVLSELARDPSLVVVSLPVDYWDYIGWKDTFARPEFTARQKAYAAARGDGQVYTPQAVVDGLTHVVGADRAAILSAVASDTGAKGALALDVTAKAINGRISVDVGQGAAQRASVWLFETRPEEKVAIGRGENAGRTLTYSNVAQKMTKLGEWTGAPANFETAVAPSKDAAYIVLVQAGSPGHPGAILGAAKAH